LFGGENFLLITFFYRIRTYNMIIDKKKIKKYSNEIMKDAL